MATNDDALARLEDLLARRWRAAVARPHIRGLPALVSVADRRLYALYLVQLHHYTQHAPRSQALAGVNPRNQAPEHRRYCFEHALEAVGHERLALRDLHAAGYDLRDPAEVPPPLPATELLIAYLYWVAIEADPVRRLGYGYFAERAYGFIDASMAELRERMGCAPSELSFYGSHKRMEERRGDDVGRLLTRVCKTSAEWQAVERTAGTAFDLVLQVVEQVGQSYASVKGGSIPPGYERLAVLPPRER
ncbi:MAG: iron-containing redox enzyme family protein [Labilithrix sp.]|nr:iron-containing redox enzyme family protein [Labilithrix sp.]